MATAKVKPIVFRLGHTVQLVRNPSVRGKVIGIRDTQVGQFIEVNFGDKKAPNTKALRPSQIQKF